MSQKPTSIEKDKSDNGLVPVVEPDHIIPPEKGDEVVIHEPPKPNEEGIVFPQFKDILIGKPDDS